MIKKRKLGNTDPLVHYVVEKHKLQQKQKELADMEGPLYEKGLAAAGKEQTEHNIAVWRAMVPALEIGELCPHHLHGRKPA